MKLKRKKAAVKKTNKNTRLSVSSTNDSVPDGDSGADWSNSSPDSDDDDESDDYHENENEKKKKRVNTVRKPISISQSRVSLIDPIIERSLSQSPLPPSPKVDKKLRASRVEKQDWPLDEVDAYCHQCRRKTFYGKMQ